MHISLICAITQPLISMIWISSLLCHATARQKSFAPAGMAVSFQRLITADFHMDEFQTLEVNFTHLN